jgi:hypothetical protein
MSIALSACPQLNENGEFNIDEELENVPPEIIEEGHRVVKACQQTRKDVICTLHTFFLHVTHTVILPDNYPTNESKLSECSSFKSSAIYYHVQ